MNTVKPVTEEEQRFVESLKTYIAALDGWRRRQAQLAVEIAQNNARLAQILPQVEKTIGKEDARLTELLRRLAIGIVVVSFFLVLVRFVGSLYRADYREVLRADLDDMFIRSFYVAFKAAGTDVQQRAAVLSTLISATASARTDPVAATDPRKDKEVLEFARELIAAAMKKL